MRVKRVAGGREEFCLKGYQGLFPLQNVHTDTHFNSYLVLLIKTCSEERIVKSNSQQVTKQVSHTWLLLLIRKNSFPGTLVNKQNCLVCFFLCCLTRILKNLKGKLLKRLWCLLVKPISSLYSKRSYSMDMSALKD